MDLKGAEVLIAGFESGEDPVLAQKIREGWTSSLVKYKASSVLFLPPDVKLSLNREFKEE